MHLTRFLVLSALFALSAIVYAANWDKDDIEVRSSSHEDFRPPACTGEDGRRRCQLLFDHGPEAECDVGADPQGVP